MMRSLGMIAAIVSTALAASAGEAITGSLSVTCDTGRKASSVHCKVDNVAGRRLEYWMHNCSTWMAWKSDNPAVRPASWGCDKNFREIEFLEPDETREFDVLLTLNRKAAKGVKTFRIAFMPEQPTKEEAKVRLSVAAQTDERIRNSGHPIHGPFWSNELKIEDVFLSGETKP